MTALWVQAHGDVGLVCQSELLSLDNIVNILVLADGVLWASTVLTRFRSLREYFGSEARVICEEFGRINLGNRVDGYVGCLMFESTMDKHICIDAPNGCTETLNSPEFVPLG